MLEGILADLVSGLRDLGEIGIVVFIVLHIILGSLGLPCSPLTLGAGVLWGGGWGTVYSLAGFVMSCSVTFLLSRRYGLRVMMILPERIQIKIQNALSSDFFRDWRSVALFSTNPIIPAASTGYLFGLTKIRFSEYIFPTVIAVLPMQFAYVYLGDGFIKSIQGSGPVKLIVGLIMFAAFFCFYKKMT